MPEHKKLWDSWCDGYYLELLRHGLNDIPKPPKSFVDMSETEITHWLAKVDFAKHEKENEKKSKINPPSKQERCSSSQSTKSNVINLKLSLEDNSTLTGTAAILEQFGKEFSIPCSHNYEISFNKLDKTFDIMSARMQYEFMRSVDIHSAEMQHMEREMLSYEKHIDTSAQDVVDNASDSTDSEDCDTRPPVSAPKNAVQKPKDKFSDLYQKVSKIAHDFTQSTEDDTLDNAIQQLSKYVESINCARDQYGRTILHCAVETKNSVLVKLLLTVGVNPNAKEGCGETPMMIAVINADVDMTKLLLENFAEFEGPLFGTLPSPVEIATEMELTDIVELFRLYMYSQANENTLVDELQNINSSFTEEQSLKDSAVDMDRSVSPAESDGLYEYKRSEFEGFPVAVVGDVGTCKVNRSVKQRNGSAYGWMTEIPGDMHAKGHLCEAAFKAHGKGGFHKLVHSVMKRPKLTEEAFKKRKFQEQNLNHIQEAVRDASCSYGLAAVQEFMVSDEFPSDEDLTVALRKYGDHNSVMLNSFKSG